MSFSTQIIKYMPARAMIESYLAAQKEVREAFRLLDCAKKRLHSAFGPYHDRVLPDNCRDYNLEREAKQSLEMIRRNAWRGVISKTQINRLISSKRKHQLEEQLKRGELPELQLDTLYSVITDLGSNVERFLTEAVQEIFEWLRPRNSRHKTNTEFEISAKVIISDAMDTLYSVVLNHYDEHLFASLDSVFHLLEGKGVSKYPDDAVTKINEAGRNGNWQCETTYFKFRWYKNGNMHITFKRLDLVNELNRIAGGRRIKS